MRRLPIFLIVDVSESMVGESMIQLEEGIKTIVSSLQKDPYVLETAYLSVIVFAGKARTIIPLTEMFAFCPPELPVGGGTALGAALDHLMDELDRNIMPTTPERKGDWKPLIFLLTDGAPTDDVSSAIQRWDRSYRFRSNLVAVSIGGSADHTVLKRLTEEVVVFDDTVPEAFPRFVRWVSMSIQAQSRSVSAGQDGKVYLAKPEEGLIVPVEETGALSPFVGVDDRFAVFLGRCTKNQLPYVIKFKHHIDRLGTRDPGLAKALDTRSYMLETVVPVKESYFDLTDETAAKQSVISDQLIGQPACPHCGAPVGMAICDCGGILCISSDGYHSCPWCEEAVQLVSSEEGFDIARGSG